jgi:hypothetical protein
LAYTFQPASEGSYNEATSLQYSTEHNGSGYSLLGPYFTGTGIGVLPVATINPGSLTFGNVEAGSKSTVQTLTLTNDGATALSIASIATSGSTAFSQNNDCGAMLASLASCTVRVIFAPGAVTAFAGTLTFTDNSNGKPGSKQTVSLTGTGIPEPVNIFVVNSDGTVSSRMDDGTVRSSNVSGGGLGAAVDRSGLLFSIDADGTGISAFNTDGSLASNTTGQFTGASALAIDGNDQLWIAAPGVVVAMPILGGPSTAYTDSNLRKPTGISIDLSGNVWIADGGSNTVHEILGGGLPASPLADAVTTNTPGMKP